METIIPVSELQSEAEKVVASVKDTGDSITIIQDGKPAALLVNYEDYEGMLATVEELSHTDWQERLAEAERDSAAGKGIELCDFIAKKP